MVVGPSIVQTSMRAVGTGVQDGHRGLGQTRWAAGGRICRGDQGRRKHMQKRISNVGGKGEEGVMCGTERRNARNGRHGGQSAIWLVFC